MRSLHSFIVFRRSRGGPNCAAPGTLIQLSVFAMSGKPVGAKSFSGKGLRADQLGARPVSPAKSGPKNAKAKSKFRLLPLKPKAKVGIPKPKGSPKHRPPVQRPLYKCPGKYTAPAKAPGRRHAPPAKSNNMVGPLPMAPSPPRRRPPPPRTWTIGVETLDTSPPNNTWRALATVCIPVPDGPCDVGELLVRIRGRAGPEAADASTLYLEIPPSAPGRASTFARFCEQDDVHTVINDGDILIAAPAGKSLVPAGDLIATLA